MLLNEIASKPSLVYLEYIFVHKASMNGTVGMGLLLGGGGDNSVPGPQVFTVQTISPRVLQAQ